jgi:hypothetical protein
MAGAPIAIRNTQHTVRVCKRTLTFQLNLLRKILGVEDYALVRTRLYSFQLQFVYQIVAAPHGHASPASDGNMIKCRINLVMNKRG